MADTIQMIMPDGNGNYGVVDTGIPDPFDGVKTADDLQRAYDKMYGVKPKSEEYAGVGKMTVMSIDEFNELINKS